jgi:hypothetical protein
VFYALFGEATRCTKVSSLSLVRYRTRRSMGSPRQFIALLVRLTCWLESGTSFGTQSQNPATIFLRIWHCLHADRVYARGRCPDITDDSPYGPRKPSHEGGVGRRGRRPWRETVQFASARCSAIQPFYYSEREARVAHWSLSEEAWMLPFAVDASETATSQLSGKVHTTAASTAVHHTFNRVTWFIPLAKH